MVPIVWGFPLPEDMESLLAASARKEVRLGGCCIVEDPPEWHCNACGRDWRERELAVR